jgi:hypothetical protein
MAVWVPWNELSFGHEHYGAGVSITETFRLHRGGDALPMANKPLLSLLGNIFCICDFSALTANLPLFHPRSNTKQLPSKDNVSIFLGKTSTRSHYNWKVQPNSSISSTFILFNLNERSSQEVSLNKRWSGHMAVTDKSEA